MVPLVAILAFRQDVTAERALREGTRVLAAFDVPGPYVVARSMETEQNGAPEFVLSVGAGDGNRYGVYVWKASGQCWWVGRRLPEGDRSADYRPADALDARKQIAKAERGMKRLGVAEALLPTELAPGWKTDRLSFRVAVDGRPFLTGEYGYGVTLNAFTGAFFSFSASDPPPEVDRVAPRLTANDALAAAKRMMPSDPPPKYDPKTRRAKPWTENLFEARTLMPNFGNPGKRQLGWFLPEGRTRARLAWSVPYWSMGHSTKDTYGSLRRIMIDAATGERLAAKPGTL